MADNSYMDGHGFNEKSGLRASDADRDAAAAVVNNALAEGRLTADEHSERLDAIYAAKTQSELVPLLADLPGQRAAASAMATSQQLAKPKRSSRMVAIFSGDCGAHRGNPNRAWCSADPSRRSSELRQGGSGCAGNAGLAPIRALIETGSG